MMQNNAALMPQRCLFLFSSSWLLFLMLIYLELAPDWPSFMQTRHNGAKKRAKSSPNR